MKICYFGNYASVHLQRWSEWIAEKGHEVHVITHSSTNSLPENVQKRAQMLGINLYCVRYTMPLINRIHRYFPYLADYLDLYTNWMLVPLFRRCINKINPDIVHGHYITNTAVFTVFSTNHPRVLSAWGSDVLIDPKKYKFWHYYFVYLLKKVDVIISVAQHITYHISDYGIDTNKIYTIPMGLDYKKFNPYIKPKFVGSDHIIISTRTLNPKYNVSLLVHSIPNVVEENRKVKFLICGEGPDRKKLEELTNHLRIEGNTQFLGEIPHDELPSYFTSACIYVSTSLTDGASVSLMEAMASGLFPIVTDIEANKEWIKNGDNGFLVPVDDPIYLSKKILEAIYNKNLRDSARMKNLKIIQDRAIWDNNMQEVEKIYYRLIEKKSN